MVNIPLLTRVSYKSGGFLAGFLVAINRMEADFIFFLGRITYPGYESALF